MNEHFWPILIDSGHRPKAALASPSARIFTFKQNSCIHPKEVMGIGGRFENIRRHILTIF